VSINNSEWPENPSSRRCQIFKATFRSQIKLEEIFICQTKTTWTITKENVLATRQQITIAGLKQTVVLFEVILKPVWAYGI